MTVRRCSRRVKRLRGGEGGGALGSDAAQLAAGRGPLVVVLSAPEAQFAVLDGVPAAGRQDCAVGADQAGGGFSDKPGGLSLIRRGEEELRFARARRG